MIKLLFLLLLVIPSLSFGATYYVATTGTDNAGCEATSSPCATVNYVLQNKVSAGDTIKMKAGNYGTTQGWIRFNNTTNHDNVTLTADDPLNPPTLVGTNANPTYITIGPNYGDAGVDGVIISYLSIRYRNDTIAADGMGIINIGGLDTTIDHCTIFQGQTGIAIRTSKRTTISNNTIYNCGVLGSGNDAHGIGIYNYQGASVATGWSERIWIYNNVIYNCSGDGLQDVSGQASPGNAVKYLDIENNTIYGNDEQALDFKGSSYVRIHGNNLSNNGYGGIGTNSSYGPHQYWWIYNNKIHDHVDYAILPQGAQGCYCNNGAMCEKYWYIYNNLIYNNSTGTSNSPAVNMPDDGGNSYFYNNTVYNTNGATATGNKSGIIPCDNGNNIKNNIFFNNGTDANDHGNIRAYAGEDSGTPDHNYVYPTTCGSGSCTTGTNAVTSSNPGMTNPSGGDFTLLNTSVCKDAGVNLGSSYNVDYIGTSRPQGAAWDIGAYEVGKQPSAPTNLRIQ